MDRKTLNWYSAVNSTVMQLKEPNYGDRVTIHTAMKSRKLTLLEKCLYSEIFWSIFSRIQTKYSPYSVRMKENKDQKNSEYGHFSRSVILIELTFYEALNKYEFRIYFKSLTLKTKAKKTCPQIVRKV